MIDRDVKYFLLKYLVRKNDEAVAAVELKQAVRAAFQVSFSEGDLNNYLAQCEDQNWISGTDDALLGRLWSLTPKGRIKGQQL